MECFIYRCKILPSMSQQVYIIQYKQEKYLDFNTLLYLYAKPDCEASERSNLWRYLRQSKIKSVRIKNMRIWSLDDAIADTILLGLMKNILPLAAALEVK